MQKTKTILISPLDWGLGHAGRIIPVIRLLLKQNHKVIVAASGLQKNLIKSEFPDLIFEDIVQYDIKFSNSDSQFFKILYQIPKIIRAIIKEKKQVKRIVKKHSVDIIISDNRYGFRNKSITSYFITHQAYIITPVKIKFFENLLNIINAKLINKFDKCLIVDNKENSIAEKLSHGNKNIKNKQFIGLLSRFEKLNLAQENDILVILSGPEPQRTILENIIEDKLANTNFKVVIVRGNNKEKKSEFGNIEYISFANSSKLNKLICSSKYIISRAGYSSIMDYIKLNKKAVLIPTPGQTEQEYLSELMMQKGFFVSSNQNNIVILDLIVNLENTKLPAYKENKDLLEIINL